MQCSEHSARMSLALDGRLDAGRRLELQQHLATCSACRQEWAALQAFAALAQRYVAPAPGMAARIARRLAEHETRRRRLHSTLRLCLISVGLWFVAGATLGAVFLLLWGGVLKEMARSIDPRQILLLFRHVIEIGRTLWHIATAQSSFWMPMTIACSLAALALFLLWTRLVLLRWAQATMHVNSWR